MWSKCHWGLLVIIFGLFWFKGYTSLDPDFGGHVRMGQVIMETGIPKTDPFSYTMPSYPYVDHEWLTNVIIESWYQRIGMVGLSAAFAFLTVVVFGASFWNKWKWSLISMLMGWSVFWPRGGVRPQVETWVFLAFLLRLMEEKTWLKWKWLFPLLMFLWANLHGGFAIGVVVVVIAAGVKILQIQKVIWEDVGVLVVGFGATLLNPYGLRLWQEVLTQMGTSGFLRNTVAEWGPFYASVDWGFWALALFVVQLGWRYRKKIETWKWVILAGLFMAGVFSLRHMALFVVVAMPILAQILEEMDLEFRKGESGKRWRWFYKVLARVFVTLIVIEIGMGIVTYKSLSEEKFYPKKAVGWLKQQHFSGQVFSDYGWGSYLTWKYPEKKVFVDGRMPSLKWKAPDGERDWVFKDYLDIVSEGKNLDSLFEQYNVRVALLPKRNLGERRTLWQITLPDWWPKKEIKKKSLVERLEEKGWKKIYEDEVAVVYQRKMVK